jgi:hypothetical protein
MGRDFLDRILSQAAAEQQRKRQYGQGTFIHFFNAVLFVFWLP